MKTAVVGVLTAAGLVLLGAASSAQARLSCSLSGPPDNLLTVHATGIDTDAVIRRSGDLIVVRQFLGRRRSCSGGDPTVFNTDSIRILHRRDARAELSAAGGPFAPGATPEPEGASEIETEFRGRLVQAVVVGTAGADEFWWGPGGAHHGLNLNPRTAGDRDVDVTVRGFGSFMVVAGAKGADEIGPAPDFLGGNDGVFAIGGRGNDQLSAPARRGGILQGEQGHDRLTGNRSSDRLTGGAGDDLIAAGGGPDSINPGRGRDRVAGGPGRDRINARDSQRDVVMCGRGLDRVRVDPHDRVRGCEFIRN